MLTTNTVHGTLDPTADGYSGTLTPEQLEQVRLGVPASPCIELPDAVVKERR